MFDRLLGNLNRVFSTDPAPRLALRVRHSAGPLAWEVRDGVLRLSPEGDISAPTSRALTSTTTIAANSAIAANASSTSGGAAGSVFAGEVVLNLEEHTLGSLAETIGRIDHYELPAAPGLDLYDTSALALIEGAGRSDESNGDRLLAFTSPLWAILAQWARALSVAAAQVRALPRQLSTTTAEGDWLDEIGGYYGVPRLPREQDAIYSERIIAEVLRPAGNNVAMEMALERAFGSEARVDNVILYGNPIPAYDGVITHNGAYQHNASVSLRYGLFDVSVGYDVLGSNAGNLTDFRADVTRLVNRLRDAGTHMRTLILTAAPIEDTLATRPGDEGMGALAVSFAVEDTLAARPGDDGEPFIVSLLMEETPPRPTEGPEDSITITTNYTYGGALAYGGRAAHRGVGTTTDFLDA